jgi:hypothetical protein
LNTAFEAYNLELSQLVQFYQKLNQPITYSDGMTTSLGIVYWGRDEHLPELELAIPIIREAGPNRFHDLLESIRTPTRAREFAETTGISTSLLRILKHDIAMWLPISVPLEVFPYLSSKPTGYNLCRKNASRSRRSFQSRCTPTCHYKRDCQIL